ncbi:MAG: VWA domain-containing protein [Chromatiaceae bacterium]|nr:VWA domain-containing protein [Chromatiaceae bacterium]
MNLHFAWPWLLLALPLPLLTLRLLPRADIDPAAALRVPFLTLLGGSGLLQSSARPARWRRMSAIAAWALLVVAAARPQVLGEAVQVPVSGRSLMLAVDISGSMINEDMQVGNRLVTRVAAVKVLASDFLRRRVGDRVGLILFGREAYLQAPLTLDRQTVATLLGEAQVGLAGKETAIGDAIGLAVKRLRDQPEQNRVLILLTDGANTAGAVDPLKAADLAAQEGVRVYTIGVGGDSMLLQTPFGTQRLPGGDLDEDTLRGIASKTGGRYFRARDTASLAHVYEELDAIEPASDDALRYRPTDEVYVWPLGFALLLTVLAALRLGRLRRTVSTAGVEPGHG